MRFAVETHRRNTPSQHGTWTSREYGLGNVLFPSPTERLREQTRSTSTSAFEPIVHLSNCQTSSRTLSRATCCYLIFRSVNGSIIKHFERAFWFSVERDVETQSQRELPNSLGPSALHGHLCHGILIGLFSSMDCPMPPCRDSVIGFGLAADKQLPAGALHIAIRLSAHSTDAAANKRPATLELLSPNHRRLPSR